VEFLRKRASPPNATLEQAEKEHFERDRPTSLIRRMAEDSEVASLVAYLASPLAAATKGAAIRVEGGILRGIL
jgi:NAD(P)-dependent dehydrogenase (short-subunit alcohol dehydrogenase family)